MNSVHYDTPIKKYIARLLCTLWERDYRYVREMLHIMTSLGPALLIEACLGAAVLLPWLPVWVLFSWYGHVHGWDPLPVQQPRHGGPGPGTTGTTNNSSLIL